MNVKIISQRIACGMLTALIAGTGMIWPLSPGLDARELKLAHKIVPENEINDSALRLAGTAVTDDPRQSLAVIEDAQRRRQWVFHEGDHAGRILIKAIRRDHIVIDAGAGEQMVKLRHFLTEVYPSPPKQSAGPSVTRINRVSSRERHKVLDRATVEATLADPEAVLESIDVMPARLFNRKTGFRIAGVGKQSIFSQMGLRSGDLLLAINEQEIAGPQEAVAFIKSLRDGGDIDLTVRRRARTYHINLLIQ
jgi:type II secretion system protein C